MIWIPSVHGARGCLLAVGMNHRRSTPDPAEAFYGVFRRRAWHSFESGQREQDFNESMRDREYYVHKTIMCYKWASLAMR